MPEDGDMPGILSGAFFHVNIRSLRLVVYCYIKDIFYCE